MLSRYVRHGTLFRDGNAASLSCCSDVAVSHSQTEAICWPAAEISAPMTYPTGVTVPDEVISRPNLQPRSIYPHRSHFAAWYYVVPEERTMNAPEISGHVALPIALMPAEEVEQLLTRFGRRSGILLDLAEIDQSPGAGSKGGEPYEHEAAPLRGRRRAVCYVLSMKRTGTSQLAKSADGAA